MSEGQKTPSMFRFSMLTVLVVTALFGGSLAIKEWFGQDNHGAGIILLCLSLLLLVLRTRWNHRRRYPKPAPPPPV